MNLSTFLKKFALRVGKNLQLWRYLLSFRKFYQQNILGIILRKNKEIILFPSVSLTDSHMLYRLSFYFPNDEVVWADQGNVGRLDSLKRPEYFDSQVELSSKLKKESYLSLIVKILSLKPTFIWDVSGFKRLWLIFPNVINVDPKLNPFEGGQYFLIHSLRYQTPVNVFNFSKMDKKKAIVLGSGPSIDLIDNIETDGYYVIICNTIVKNLELLARIKPSFLVFADPIYHYGPSVYATAFRRALISFLTNDQDCVVLIPHLFLSWMNDSYPEYAHRFYSIPPSMHFNFVLDYKKEYTEHRYVNVLNQMLIPLAATLSDEIYFLGFDGRSKNDKGFWAHSNKNNFVELLPFQNLSHPSFFYKKDLAQHAVEHAELTETLFLELERNGKKVVSLSSSNNSAMQSRYIDKSLTLKITKPGSKVS